MYLILGIISSSGTHWKHQRTFALSKLRDFGFGKRSFEPSILDEIEYFLRLLEKYKGQSFDIDHLLQTTMANNIMSITVGRRFEYDDPKFRHFIKCADENVKNAAFIGPANFVPILAQLPGDFFGAKRIVKSIGAIYDFFREEIKDHENTFDENNMRDFIDVYLCEMRKNDTNRDIFTGKA